MVQRARGGFFLIKLFDKFTRVSIDMMFLLSLLYEEVYIVKPKSSRYANSEKYVVCKNFRLDKTASFDDAIDTCEKHYSSISKKNEAE